MNKTKLKSLLAILVVIGIIAPYYFLLSYIADNGFTFTHIVNEVISTRLSIFGWVDVIISAITLLVFMFVIRRLPASRMAVVVIATCLVGVSAGLPLYLYFLVDRDVVKLRDSNHDQE